MNIADRQRLPTGGNAVTPLPPPPRAVTLTLGIEQRFSNHPPPLLPRAVTRTLHSRGASPRPKSFPKSPGPPRLAPDTLQMSTQNNSKLSRNLEYFNNKFVMPLSRKERIQALSKIILFKVRKKTFLFDQKYGHPQFTQGHSG
uniref:Uncharacterized protein n=1 Tax=Cacopsylla melanoneura TaxID=428564 RepID=A0A8D8M0G4_9HEMI